MRSEALRERLEGAGLLESWPELPAAAGAPEAGALPAAELTGVTTDSRSVQPGALFVAYRGATSDGHDYLPAAAHAGAALALVERPVPGAALPQSVVRSGRRAAAVAAALYHGDPARGLVLVGVTGTNGKTTTVTLLRHLLGGPGRTGPAASIGTLGTLDGEGNPVPAGPLTTPGPVELHAVLAALGRRGTRTVAMEVSSHSLDQERVAGLAFRAVVYTNFTRDHLDYHLDEAAYLAAKLKLSDHLSPDGLEVVNAADPAWRALPPRSPRSTYGIECDADVVASGIEGDARGTRFLLAAAGASREVALPLLGRYNVENALAAAAVALGLGHELGAVAERLASAPQVLGRMERLSDSPCAVLRDYAHTSDGMQRALAALRPLTAGRLILVFGCGGDRDRGKRPAMGRVAARDADLVILTADNPRSEDVNRILDDIEAGMDETPHLRIVDRRAAIGRVLSLARAGDTVLLAGKGHETYQHVGNEKLPFDEREIVAGFLAEPSAAQAGRREGSP